MNIQVLPDYEQLCKIAGYMIASQVISKPNTVLGAATGATALGVYSALCNHYDAGDVDFSRTKIFNLDAYYGLEKSHIQSHYNYTVTNLIDRINVPIESFFIPDGVTNDVHAECKNYEKLIDLMGGIDLQLLGLGRNGHIGYNEPSDSFSPYTYLVDLSETTREANAHYFEHISDVPHKAISMGIGTIMKAKKIILFASGYEKATAVREMVEKRVTPKCPASILQFHSNVTVLLDEAAASML